MILEAALTIDQTDSKPRASGDDPVDKWLENIGYE